MTRTTALLAAWLTTQALAPSMAVAADPFAAPATDASVFVLDNGLRVVVEQQPRTDRTALYLKLMVGARDEERGERGCAHLFEHLMFEGSAHVPNDGFDRLLTAAGGENNAWTSYDETVYYMTFPSGALDLALFLESDRVGFLDAGLTEANLRNQQDVVLQERRESFDAPHGRDHAALMQLLFPAGHPYHVSVIGTEADVQGFTLDAVRVFWQRHYKTRNAVLVLVGPEPVETMVEAARRWFDDVVDTGEAGPRPTAPPTAGPSGPRQGALADRVEDTTLYAAWPTVPLGHADEPALDLLSWILDDGPGTVMHDRLSTVRPLDDFGAWADHADVAGWFTTYASSRRWPAKTLARTLDRTLDRIRRKAPSQAAVDRARATVKAGLLAGMDVPSSRAETLLRCYDLFGEPNCLPRALGRLDAVTPEDIQRVANTWLTDDRRVTLTVHPEQADPPSDAVPLETP